MNLSAKIRKVESKTKELYLFCDRNCGYAQNLSQNCFSVATTVRKIFKKVWNVTKVVVPLQCQKSTNRLATEKRSEILKV